MEASDLREWLHLVVRWFHVIAGIMWIGQTYLFNWMEKTFAEEIGPDGKMRLWMVHGGGFYQVEKQKVPELMPTKLHWFKYESLMSWLSGMFLLVLVYYLGGAMVDERVMHLSDAAAAGIGLGLLFVSWFVYDTIWRSPLGKSEPIGAAICYVLVLAIAWGLLQVFSARAAYMHIGAMFGTIMVTNVWVRILPGQNRMITATREGRTPDMTEGLRAKGRSRHNTFMSVPLIFIMISSHFPTATYGNDHAFAVLAVLIVLGAGAAKLIREYA